MRDKTEKKQNSSGREEGVGNDELGVDDLVVLEPVNVMRAGEHARRRRPTAARCHFRAAKKARRLPGATRGPGAPNPPSGLGRAFPLERAARAGQKTPSDVCLSKVASRI